MENLLKKLETLRATVKKTTELLKLEGMRSRLQGLEREMEAPAFWSDQNKAKAISQEAAGLREEAGQWERLLTEITELEQVAALAQEETAAGNHVDSALADDLDERLAKLEEHYKQLEFLVLFDEPYDVYGAIVTVHAGSGGTDAQDWAQILERMFLRFAEGKKWETEILDRAVGAEAGIKSVTIQLRGRWAYGHLRSEAGVHRLVRISPFDSEGMRHTSFALVDVIPELPDAGDIEINNEDLKIDVFRSSGPGGQSVNTTDSAVRITHLPTKTVVTCQNERSQQQNKETALKILKSKLQQMEDERRRAEEAKLRGETLPAEWGSQIRSYVMQPYKMVKDHRTNIETQEVERVLDGDLREFVEGYLRWRKK